MTQNFTTQAALTRLPADSDSEEIVSVIKRDGGLILTNLIAPSQATSFADELQDSVDHREPGFLSGHDDTFYGNDTIRMQSMARRSKTWVNEMLLNPVLLSIADAILHPHCGDYWLSQSELIYLGPDQAVQELHRDDLNWPFAARLEDIDLQLACLIAIGDYDAEVGATRVRRRGPGVVVGGQRVVHVWGAPGSRGCSGAGGWGAAPGIGLGAAVGERVRRVFWRRAGVLDAGGLQRGGAAGHP